MGQSKGKESARELRLSSIYLYQPLFVLIYISLHLATFKW